jgi:PST family polysaccharide transporter
MPDRRDPSRHFSTDHLKSDLKGRSVRAGAVTVGTQVMRFVLNMTATMVLARMLKPEDFGLMAMLFSLTIFVEMFRDMGLSSATVQRTTVTHRQVSTLFWINVLFSAGVGGLVVLAGPYIAAYYHDQRLVGIARWIALTFFIGGINAQHIALLTRQMRFNAQAIVIFVSMVVSTSSAIITAYLGWGYQALVVGQVVLAICITSGMWIASGWIPGLPRWDPELVPMLKYGVNLAGAGCVNTIARSLDNVLIGRHLGAAPLAFYSKAYQLVLMPLQQINHPLGRVAMPALSRLKDDPERYRRFFINAVQMTTFLGMPVVALLFVAAEPAIHLMLGPQWMESVPLFRILAPAAFFGTFNVATGWVYASLGHTHRQLRWGLLTSALAVGSYFIGLQYGAAGVATAVSVVSCGFTVGVP